MHLLTHSAILRALGWSLFNSLWQMGLLWLFYSVTVLFFRNWPSRVRHGLLLLLLTAGSVWSAVTFISAYWLAPGDSYELASFLPRQVDLFAIGRRLAVELLPYCSTLYLLILGVLLIRYGRRYRASRLLTRAGLSPITPDLDAFVAATARQMGIRPAVGVYLSSLAAVPVTLGFLKPLILVPVSMVTRLSPAQIEAILVHELAHIRRQDYLIHLLTSVQELLFFFNPFTRLLINQLRKEREHSCDDEVLQFLYDPVIYVSALLSLARHHRNNRLAVAAIDGGEKLLLQRTRKILRQKKTDHRSGAGFFVLTLLTLGLMTMTISPSRKAAPPTAKSRTVTRTVINRSIAGSALETPTYVIRNTPPAAGKTRLPEKAATAPARGHSGAGASAHTRPTRNPHLPQVPAEGNDPDGNGSLTILTADPSSAPIAEFSQLVEIDDHDYSLETPASQNAGSATSDGQTIVQPYVPASSFSFQYTDTLALDDKLAVLQQHLGNMELCWQLARLQVILAKQHKDPRLNTLRQQEQTLRTQYLKSLNDLQNQFRKAGRRLTIVYI
jgi:beta-lactamase regulating signal transducer with metallopeptidase domain